MPGRGKKTARKKRKRREKKFQSSDKNNDYGGARPKTTPSPQKIYVQRPAPKRDKTNLRKFNLPHDCRLPRDGHIPPEIWRDEIKSKHMKGGAQYTADKSYFSEDIKEEDVKEMISETAEHPDQIRQSNENKKWLLFREYEEPVGYLGVKGEECPWILVTSKKNGHMVNAYPYDDPDNTGCDHIKLTYKIE